MSFNGMRRDGHPRWSARNGWFLVGLGLTATFYLAATGPVNPVVAMALSVVMGLGLVLGLNGLFSGAPRTAGAPGAPAPQRSARATGETTPAASPRVRSRRGAFGKVPASWEFYETFGR
ncbi:hypothetical protein [Georgenia muralis]|uniref:Uncharacterized protein n=1 Tax=Georgenia muralis TaxID=154117 RepID=A0A3N4Z410_9MICO|nr:hypothetical protein [Georgenia muralis]RPF26416.1 hypothetical protein EDD32_0856 [Georgenia muralis]